MIIYPNPYVNPTNPMNLRTSSEKGVLFVQILVISVTIVVVAVPEGMCIWAAYI